MTLKLEKCAFVVVPVKKKTAACRRKCKFVKFLLTNITNTGEGDFLMTGKTFIISMVSPPN